MPLSITFYISINEYNYSQLEEQSHGIEKILYSEKSIIWPYNKIQEETELIFRQTECEMIIVIVDTGNNNRIKVPFRCAVLRYTLSSILYNNMYH